MPHKNKKLRREYYLKNREEINRKRREYSKRPEVRKRILEQERTWRINNREYSNSLSRKAKRKYEAKAKIEVFEHYGKKCACCGESNIKFLSIDHINGGGTKHRNNIKEKITTWLYRNNFPSGFQTLCFNCNWGKHINHGVCPHKEL